MWDMRDLTKKDQVAFWSAPEVRMAIDAMLSEARHSLDIEFRGGKLKQQHLLNALALYVFGLPAEERQAALRDGVATLEQVLADDRDQADEPARRLGAPTVEPDPAKGGRGRKRA